MRIRDRRVSANFEIKLLKEIAELNIKYILLAKICKVLGNSTFPWRCDLLFTTKFFSEFVDVDQNFKYLSFAKLKEYILTNLSLISGYLGNEYQEMNGKSDQ